MTTVTYHRHRSRRRQRADGTSARRLAAVATLPGAASPSAPGRRGS